MMKQNKKIVAILCIVFMLISCLSLSAFAYTDNSTNSIDFAEQPIPIFVPGSNQLDIYNSSLPIGFYNSQEYKVAQYNDVAGDTYCFLIPDGNMYSIYCASESQTSYRVSYGSDTYDWHSRQTLSDLDNDTGLYYGRDAYGSIAFSNIQIPIFSSLNIALNSVKDWIDNPPVNPSLVGAFSTQLQPGYAMYIDITNLNVSATLTQHTPVSYWGLGATQFIDTTNSIPNPITNDDFDQVINWTGTGRADSFGKYSDWVSTFSVSGSASGHDHVYLGIINPLNNNSASTSGMDVSSVANGIINVRVDNSNSVKIFPLSTSFNAGVYDSESGDVSASGHSDGNGGLTYTDDSTGDPYTQEFGGLTTPENTATTINDWLESIANSIGGFFRGAIGAVSTLVNAGREFFGVLTGLYSWLPPTVFSVLSSALIVVITIGVIKVFI